MRQLLPAVLSSLVFISCGAIAADPVKPDVGAGPHLDRSAQTSGQGTPKSDAPQPVTPEQLPRSGASTGPSGAGPSGSTPDSAGQQQDEKKATESKDKMKKKPGYQEEAPSPRASRL
jgi:hypothetical protein